MDVDYPRLIYLFVLGFALIGWIVVEYRHNLGRGLRSAIAWVFIFLGVIGAYGLWEDIQRDVTGGHILVQDGSIIEVPKGPDGHFHLELTVNDVPIWFLIDTGASDLVMSMQDAESAGLNPDQLAFIGRAQTANGVVRTARARIDRIELGPFSFENVPVSVNGGDLGGSLLGMEFLQRFDRLEFDQDRLRLIP